MNSRDQILRDVRAHLPVDAPLPPLTGPWTKYEHATEHFLETLRGVGGVGLQLSGLESLRDELTSLADRLQARQICSAMGDMVSGNVNLAAVTDPHELADVDLAILPGEFAVAENAAVWVTNAVVPERVTYFLSQHVALVVPANRVVHNLHEAYSLLVDEAGPGGPFHTARWGAFMSGPSKTADIEQALVIGAHGARSLHVYLFSP